MMQSVLASCRLAENLDSVDMAVDLMALSKTATVVEVNNTIPPLPGWCQYHGVEYSVLVRSLCCVISGI